MAIPTKKSKPIESLLNELSPQPIPRYTAIINNKCVWCGEDVGLFKDDLSRKEYSISGFCQKCQDSVFG